MAKAADVVVQCLENEGVEYVFGIPGEENLDLLESLRKSKIKLVLTRHEQSAARGRTTVSWDLLPRFAQDRTRTPVRLAHTSPRTEAQGPHPDACRSGMSESPVPGTA